MKKHHVYLRALIVTGLSLFALFTGCSGENAFRFIDPTPADVGSQGVYVDPSPMDYEKPTYSNTISKLFNKHCTSCHQGQGGIAPFSLTNYQDAKNMAQAIKSSVAARRMPPPGVDDSGSCQTFSNANWLSDKEIAAIARWADNEAPQGDARVDNVPATPLTKLAEPKKLLTMPQAYKPQPPAGSLDDYRCFVLDPGLTEDTKLTGIEILPQNSSEVHHVIVFKPSSEQAQADAEALQGKDGRPGYTCFGAAGVPSTVVGLWAPGGNAREMMDPDTGNLLGHPIEKGRKLILQIHYNTANGSVPDQSSISVKFNPKAASVKWMVLVDFMLDLAAGKQAVSTSDEQGNSWMQAINIIFERGLADEVIRGGGWSSALNPELIGVFLNQPDPRDMRVYAVAPHMHTTGRKIKVEKLTDGKSTCLGDVPKFDFHWQGGYNYKRPLTVGKDDRFKITCEYNTMGRTEDISFGEGTEDEMCLAFLLVAE